MILPAHVADGSNRTNHWPGSVSSTRHLPCGSSTPAAERLSAGGSVFGVPGHTRRVRRPGTRSTCQTDLRAYTSSSVSISRFAGETSPKSSPGGISMSHAGRGANTDVCCPFQAIWISRSRGPASAAGRGAAFKRLIGTTHGRPGDVSRVSGTSGII